MEPDRAAVAKGPAGVWAADVAGWADPGGPGRAATASVRVAARGYPTCGV